MDRGENKSKFHILHKIAPQSNLKVVIGILVASVVLGLGSGYYLASTKSGGGTAIPIINEKPKSAAQDSRTFRDMAEGKITKKPDEKPGAYSEGTHLLVRDGAVPVALTSSVVDLSQYENKKVKVYGETQKALKEGWLMDVGKVEEAQ